jgi:hypothetical protein
MCIMKEEPLSSAFERTYCIRTHVRSSPEGTFESMSTSAETLAFHVEGPRRTELEALRSNAHIAFERTRDDLAAREKTLVLVYIYHFVFCCKRWEAPERAKTRILSCLGFCERFLIVSLFLSMISIDNFLSVVVMRG